MGLDFKYRTYFKAKQFSFEDGEIFGDFMLLHFEKCGHFDVQLKVFLKNVEKMGCDHFG